LPAFSWCMPTPTVMPRHPICSLTPCLFSGAGFNRLHMPKRSKAHLYWPCNYISFRSTHRQDLTSYIGRFHKFKQLETNRVALLIHLASIGIEFPIHHFPPESPCLPYQMNKQDYCRQLHMIPVAALKSRITGHKREVLEG